MNKVRYAFIYVTGNYDWNYFITDCKIDDWKKAELCIWDIEGKPDYGSDEVMEGSCIQIKNDKFLYGCKTESSDYYFGSGKETANTKKKIGEYLELGEETDYISTFLCFEIEADEHVYTKNEIKQLEKEYKKVYPPEKQNWAKFYREENKQLMENIFHFDLKYIIENLHLAQTEKFVPDDFETKIVELKEIPKSFKYKPKKYQKEYIIEIYYNGKKILWTEFRDEIYYELKGEYEINYHLLDNSDFYSNTSIRSDELGTEIIRYIKRNNL